MYMYMYLVYEPGIHQPVSGVRQPVTPYTSISSVWSPRLLLHSSPPPPPPVAKLMWFRERIDEGKELYTVEEMTELVKAYVR